MLHQQQSLPQRPLSSPGGSRQGQNSCLSGKPTYNLRGQENPFCPGLSTQKEAETDVNFGKLERMGTQ
jgi:hypothetical protein